MNLTEAFEVLFKGAKYGAGTIRTWANGKQYQKQADGKWVEYKVGAKQAIKEGVGKLHMKGEDDIVMLTHERAYIYDKKGNIAHQIDGNEKYIEFTKEQLSLMKGKVCTHNHPSYLKKKVMVENMVTHLVSKILFQLFQMV
jgi:hypothetical protein